VRSLGGVPPSIGRYSETRYASVAILALRYMENQLFILSFLFTVRTLLTELDLQALKWLLTPEISNIILGRALFASRVMPPIMKDAAVAEKTTAWLSTIQTYQNEITKFAKEPALLANQKIERKDAAILDRLPDLTKKLLDAVEVQLKLPQRPIDEREEDALRLVGATVTDDNDDEDDDDDDSGGLETWEEEEVLEEGQVALPASMTTFNTTASDSRALDLSRPSGASYPEPSVTEKTRSSTSATRQKLFSSTKRSTTAPGLTTEKRTLW